MASDVSLRLLKNPQDPKGKPIIKTTPKYLELLTIFPDNSPESRQFIDFLHSQQNRTNSFQKLW